MVVTTQALQILLLIFFRIAGVMMRAPILSSQHIPPPAKVAFAFWVSIVLWFVIPAPHILPPMGVIFVLALVNELVIGFLMGFLTEIIFEGVQSAGELMDLQMGLSVATVFDPTLGAQISVIGKFLLMLALTLFVIAGGPQMILTALHHSFQILPIGMPANIFSENLVMYIVSTVQKYALITIQLSAPIILLLFLTDFSFGIVSRVAPQVNVFMLGFQVKPSIGLVGIFFILPLLVRHIMDLVPLMGNNLITLMGVLR